MITCKVHHEAKVYEALLEQAIDISIPMHPGGPRAWYVDALSITPVRTAQFTGSVAEGGAVNFRDIWFNPHGHGTHTECYGHIANEVHSVNQALRKHLMKARLISIQPEMYQGPELPHMRPGDAFIPAEALESAALQGLDAVVVRTLPNPAHKLERNYSASNPPYFAPEALSLLRAQGVQHLLTDLPSVDREEDGGALLAHRAFWYSGHPDDESCTITEMVYVPQQVEDGLYLLQLGMAPFENDASPSKPILYALREVEQAL